MKLFSALLFLLPLTLGYASSSQTNEDYCVEAGGKVEIMPMHYDTHAGMVEGASKRFCTFMIDQGFVAVGLSTFASDKPSIAATFIKKMQKISPDSRLFKGKYSNPSLNFCKNIGGSSVLFNVMGGGFANDLGEIDMCVFGDGSMISGWSLIYIANEEQGFDLVRNKTKAEPMNINIPE